MGRIVVSQFITLDGVVEDPGGSEDLDRGGWAFAFDRGAEGDKFKLDEAMGSDALLLGRRTYEGFAAAWPSRSGEFADKFNTMPKHVISSSLRDPGWANTTAHAGDPLDAVRSLRERYEGDVLVRALLDAGLVDELRLMVFPTVLGAGKRLFGERGEEARMRVVESRPAGETLIVRLEPAAADA